jgi:hypothetical protein
MDEQQMSQPQSGEAKELGISITAGARALGVDSFTLFSLIQRGRLSPRRSHSGEITIPEVELA